MTDSRKNVDINIKITGDISKKLTQISKSFKQINDAVEKAQKSFKDLSQSISNIKLPKNFAKTVENLNNLGKVKVSKTIATNISAIATAANKLAKVDSSNISKLKTNIQKLSGLSISRSQSTTLNAYSEALRKFKGLSFPNFSRLVAGMNRLKGVDLGPVSSQLKRLADALEPFRTVKLPGVGALVKSFTNLQKINISAVVVRVLSLERAIQALDRSGRLNAFKKFASDLRSISTVLQQSKKAADSASESIGRLGMVATRSGANVKTFGDRIKNYLQYRGIADSVMGLQEALLQVVPTISEYDQALKDLQAITDATDDQVSQMGVTIKEVASGTKFSASEVAAGMRTIGQAGFTAQESMQTMQAVSDLATGTLTEMSTSVDLVSTAMRVFDIQAENSAHVADVFANAVNRSKLTVDKLRIAMNYVGPIAQEAGVSFEEMTASMGTLANSGIRASTIGTGLRRVFAELVDPSKGFAEAIRSAGLVIEEVDPRVNSLSEVISNLGFVLEDAQVAFQAFGKRGAAAALALVDSSSGFSQMFQLINRSGTAAKQAEIQMEGLGVSFKNMRDKLGLLAIAIGEAGLIDFLKGLVDIVRSATDAMTAFINSGIGGIITKVALAVGVIGGFSLTFSALVSSIVKARAATALANVALATTATTATGATAKIAALSTSLSAVAPWLMAIAAAVAIASYGFSRYSRAAKEASQASAEFGNELAKLNAYIKRTATLEEGSIALSEANKDLRKSLFDVAEENSRLYASATKAANSINALSGDITDAGSSINEYKRALSELQFSELRKSLVATSKDIQEQSSFWLRNINIFKDSSKNIAEDVGKAIAGMFENDTIAEKAQSLNGLIYDVFTLFESSRKRSTQGGAFAELLSEGEVTFGELRDYAVNLQGDVSDVQLKIREAYNRTNESALKFLNYLRESEKVGAKTTVEDIKRLAENAGLAEIQIQAVVTKWKEAREAIKDLPKQGIAGLREELEDGTTSIEEYKQAYIEAGGEITKQDEEIIASSVRAKQELLQRADDIEENYKRQIEAGISVQEAENQRAYALAQLNSDLRKLYSDDLKNFTVASIKKVERAEEEYREILKKNKELYADESQVQTLLEKNAEAYVEYQKKLKKALESPFDVDTLKTNIKKRNKALEEENAERLYRISLQEAEAVENRERFDALKLESELQYYRESLSAAEEYFEQIKAASSDINSDDYVNAQNKMIDAKNKFLDFSRKATVEAVNDEREASEKIADIADEVDAENEKHLNKREVARKKHLLKITEIENESAEKIVDINSKLKDKLDDLDEERRKNNLDAAQDIESIYERSEDAIRKIRQRGMTDEEKQASDKAALYKKLQEGQELVDDALRNKDKSALDRGQRLIEQSFSLAEGMDNEKDAIKGIKEATEGLERARSAEKTLEDLENQREREEEIADAATKTKQAREEANSEIEKVKDLYADIVKEENDRHERELSNLRKEVQEWEKKLQVAQRMKQLSVEGSSSAIQPDQVGSSPTSTTSGASAVSGAVENYSKAQQQIIEIQKRGFTAVQENGKTVYTNLTSAQRSAMDGLLKVHKQASEDVTSVSEESQSELVKSQNEAISKTTDAILEKAKGGGEFNFSDNTQDIDDRINAILKQVQDSQPELEIDDSSIDDVDKKLDGLDGRITRSKHIVEKITTGMTGGLVSDLVQGFSRGGQVFKKLSNRFITSGSGLRDDVPALLKRKEFVQSEPATSYYGVDFMRALNHMLIPRDMLSSIFPGFEQGGLAADALSSISSSISPISQPQSPTQTVKFDLLPNREDVEFNISQPNLDELLDQLEELRKYRS